MTARRKRRAGSAAKRRPGWPRPPWLLPAIAVAAALGAVWWVGFRDPGPAPPAAGPWARLSPQAAFETGVELLRSGRSLASLPYLRHSFAGTRGELWEVSHAMFTALMNASFETREHARATVPATRSSAERVRLVQEALQCLTRAERVAATPRDLARIRKDRAQALLTWGFGWEAFVNYRDAQAADPTWDEPGMVADTLMSQLEFPAEGAPGLPPPGSPR